MHDPSKFDETVEEGQRSESDSPLRSSLALFASSYSIEITPKDALRSIGGLSRLPLRTRTFITRLPKGSFEETLFAAASLRDLGLRPVPHLTARTTPDARTLANRLRRLVEEAGVEEILLVAGSDDQPEGVFTNVVEMLGSGVLEASGLRSLSMAGHPEGHPLAEEADLNRALDAKNEFAARTGMQVVLVTQFFFDAAPVIAWEKRLRAAGNKLPIDPGIHGVTGVTSLMRYALACGVGASVRILGQRSGNLLQFAQHHAPDHLIGELAAARATDPSSRFRNIHLFPLGGFEKSVTWANNLRQGRVSISPRGRVTVST